MSNGWQGDGILAIEPPGQPLPPYTLRVRSGKPLHKRGSLGAIVPRQTDAVRGGRLKRRGRLSTVGNDKRAHEGSLFLYSAWIGVWTTHLFRTNSHPLPSRPHLE